MREKRAHKPWVEGSQALDLSPGPPGHPLVVQLGQQTLGQTKWNLRWCASEINNGQREVGASCSVQHAGGGGGGGVLL